MRVSCLQLEIADRTPGESLAAALALLDQARGSDLVLLPELWPTGYFAFDQYERHAEAVDGPTVRALADKAKELNTWLLMGSFVERAGSQLFNTTLLVDPAGNTVSRYRKMHTFGYQSQERALLAAGSEPATAATPHGTLGLSICYDLRFPELYRALVDRGVEIFLVAAAWPAARLEPWRLLNRARALENLSYVVACNGAGQSAGVALAGHSMIVDPWGNVVAEAGDGPQVLTCEIDVETVRRARREFPALADRVLR
ncbi:MAG: carbon-nitrogen family hydrolase [Planctomycetes bacterium]|nr:carbon-nitrogen family hydrolase [Planctomycetota bacterium]